ncbi:MAG TPA: winged helix-turn-helix domain-containing protein [Phycisphaerae bacterium]|nr:winged helix-turn-helix domain-containing protein [Phycisphaerae bacterium]HQL76378.1 winged helix-turn-helix domain-containing protein [Phycisphaerae bacterium]
MKKNEVEIGKVYRVKVGSNICDVRITGENRHGGWDGVNTATNRAVRIKSAQRLRGLAEPRPTKRKKVVSLAEYEAEVAAAAATTPPPADEPAADAAPAATEAPADAPATKRGRKAKDGEDKPKKISGLDAAAQVLADAGKPMNVGEMVKTMFEKGLWASDGKTPAATIYSAIIREINVKGDQSRFRKTERGHFNINK